ncbi:hypothetical protein B0H14DRAFT_3471094 [Mycena olivaceomarginata]|nr:hypothetical protein B0H14DRAFT_3471094 [Mycena olivaceomarginata]
MSETSRPIGKIREFSIAQGPPSFIIRDLPGPHTLSEIRKRYAIINEQRAFLEEQGGHSRMVGQIAMLWEIEAYPAWREAREQAEKSEEEKAVERRRLRRELKDAEERVRFLEARPVRVQPPSIVRRPGLRIKRETPLSEADLYLDDTRPRSISAPPILLTCTLCFNLKSHPVSYKCGHSHCYVCIRLWLETSWECPTCHKIIAAATT